MTPECTEREKLLQSSLIAKWRNKDYLWTIWLQISCYMATVECLFSLSKVVRKLA
jgi:hypothetical protein